MTFSGESCLSNKLDKTDFSKHSPAMMCSCAIKKQTGVTLRYMLDFGANPVERQLILSSQFLHNELPVRLAHRVAELENLPYGLSAKPHVLKVSLLNGK